MQRAGPRRRCRLTIRDFEAACQYLFPRTTGGIKWGLDTTRALLAQLGNPERHFAAVHVAGTNGKGSTSAFLAAMLRSAGFRTGLYTSPHLLSFTERIQVDGIPIGGAAVAAWTERLRGVADERAASFFEITTAMAFADFAMRGAEIAVVEVGLGGRLDATSVLEPLACGITRVALDHQEYLGATLQAIAFEKASIAKPGVPLLTTEPDDAVASAIFATARGLGGVPERVSPQLAAGRRLGLEGAWQVGNASLAMALAAALPDRWRPGEAAIAEGLRSARMPGRFDRRGPWLFDAAHNPDGAAALAAALVAANLPAPVAGVVSVLGDKQWKQMLAVLAPALDVLVLTRAPSAPAERAWDPAAAGEFVRGGGARLRSGAGPLIETDFAAALELARSSSATTVVTGSFTTVGDAMRRLGIDPAG